MAHENCLKQLQSAMNFVGQAQEAAPDQSDLWKECGRIFDELDTVQDMIVSNEFSADGGAI